MGSCKFHLKEALVVPLALTCGPASSSQLLAQQLVVFTVQFDQGKLS